MQQITKKGTRNLKKKKNTGGVNTERSKRDIYSKRIKRKKEKKPFELGFAAT